MRATLSLSLLLTSTLLLLSCRTTTRVDREKLAAEALTQVSALAARADIAAANAAVDSEREATIAMWREITEIAAPSGAESRRADRIEQLLREAGASEVRRDEAGNVIATRRGSGGGASLVFDAHIDTVFPESTDLTTRVESGRIYAPGVGDNARNVAALIATLRAMNAAKVTTRGDVTFVFTVEEETSFRGVEHFIASNKESIDRWVTLDGGFANFQLGSIGIYWDRYHFLGPGGHTLAQRPPYSATLPAARAIARIYELPLPEDTQLNVGMTGAGEIFNAKATDAWFSVDLRSNDQATLDRLDGEVRRIIDEEAQRVGMQSRQDTESRRKVAALPDHRNSSTVIRAEAVFRAFGFAPEPGDVASNHLSAALAAGIPAIATGSTMCRNSHSLSESCEVEPLFIGIKRNILLAVALSEP